MLIVCQDSRLARRTRNTPAACSSDSTSSCNRDRRDGERRLPYLKQEAAGADFRWFKHRTGGFRCQTTILRVRQSRPSRGATAREIKKEKTRETRWSDFLFLGSTDPVAIERLFLE